MYSYWHAAVHTANGRQKEGEGGGKGGGGGGGGGSIGAAVGGIIAVLFVMALIVVLVITGLCWRRSECVYMHTRQWGESLNCGS